MGNESFTTVPITVEDADTVDLGNKIELALQGLPNKVITNVNVNVTMGYESRGFGINLPDDVAFINLNVEFTGASVMGPQNLLIVEANLCDNGCTPKLTGLSLLSVAHESPAANADRSMLSRVTEMQPADYNNYECGRRGKCDYDSGICECFEGYTGEACSIQTALV